MREVANSGNGQSIVPVARIQVDTEPWLLRTLLLPPGGTSTQPMCKLALLGGGAGGKETMGVGKNGSVGVLGNGRDAEVKGQSLGLLTPHPM